ncbi:hypothetical protein BY996DRAFT_7058164 [Phakopsora pachyrhizi]|nr:hypothetical protein BY996DRAFT_7058164 [Phakopsora pachyrhizi]
MIPVNTIGPNSYAPPGFAQGGPTSLPIRQEASSGRAADLKSTDISDQGIQSSNSIMQDRAPANPCEISDVGSTWGRPLWWGVSRPEGCNPKINQAETPLPAQGSRSLNVMAQPTQNNPFAPGNQMNKVNLMIPQNQINPIIPQNQMAPMISQNQINPIISQNQMNPMISQNQMSPMLLPNQMNPTMFSLDENYPQGPTV